MDFGEVIANQPVVIDNVCVRSYAPTRSSLLIQGSGVIKAGFAGDRAPKCVFQSFVGKPKHVRVMAGALEGDEFIGPRAEVLPE